MIEQVLKPKNLYKAYRQVVRNKGAAGIDHMKVGELLSYLDNNRNMIINMVTNCAYVPDAIRGTVRRCGRNTKKQRKNPSAWYPESSG
jgi:RNA-directed DNA polymerase